MNVYEMVTERIIADLEKGKIPWHKPWIVSNGKGAYNYVTGKSYSLLNQLLLMHADAYLSFKQVQDLGGKINKGAKSEIVVFWKMIVKEEENEKGETEKQLIPVLRYYNVFWIGDTTLENKKTKDDAEEINNNPVEIAEDIINNYVSREHITFANQMVSNEAYYMPSMDLVNVPMINQYEHVEEYYSTVFHELTHSTGRENRLNRLGKNARVKFGSIDYSKEELVAEIGASALVNHCGMETEKSFKNNVAYLQSWLNVLKNDSRMIVSASSKAEKAVNYILGIEE